MVHAEGLLPTPQDDATFSLTHIVDSRIAPTYNLRKAGADI